MKQLIVSCILGVLGLTYVVCTYQYWVRNYDYNDVNGTYLGALFTGLALVFLIFGVTLQYLEVKELKKQNEISSADAKALKKSLKERDENTHLKDKEARFLALLNLYLDQISREKEFSFFRERFFDIYNNPDKFIPIEERNIYSFYWKMLEQSNMKDRDYLNAVFFFAYHHIGYNYSFTYRLFISLVEYLEIEFEDNSKHKKFYMGLLLSSFDKDRLVMLFFAGLSDKFQHLKKYIEDYGMLYNLNYESLRVTECTDLYNGSAYIQMH